MTPRFRMTWYRKVYVSIIGLLLGSILLDISMYGFRAGLQVPIGKVAVPLSCNPNRPQYVWKYLWYRDVTVVGHAPNNIFYDITPSAAQRLIQKYPESRICIETRSNMDMLSGLTIHRSDHKLWLDDTAVRPIGIPTQPGDLAGGGLLPGVIFEGASFF